MAGCLSSLPVLAWRNRCACEQPSFRTACSTCSSPFRARKRRTLPSIPDTDASASRARKCCCPDIPCSRSCGARARRFLSHRIACSNAAASGARRSCCHRTLCIDSSACHGGRYQAERSEVYIPCPQLPAPPSPSWLASTPQSPQRPDATRPPALHTPESTSGHEQSTRLQQLRRRANQPCRSPCRLH